MFVAFLKRLTGQTPLALEEESRLQRNLNGMAQKNRELEGLERELDATIAKVSSISLAQREKLPSGMSGGHRLNLPREPSRNGTKHNGPVSR